MFRAVVLADGGELTTAEFPQIAAQVRGYDVRIPPAPPPVAADPAAAVAFQPANLDRDDPHSLRLINDSGDVRMLEEIEIEAIRFALAHYRGQMSQMARKLGIGRSTLYRKMKDIGIADDILGDAAA
jgi:DNA-binding NtrC family response regulator